MEIKKQPICETSARVPGKTYRAKGMIDLYLCLEDKTMVGLSNGWRMVDKIEKYEWVEVKSHICESP